MKKAISIKNLEKTYSNSYHALKGVSLDISKGDFFALLGPNGAGKSTLINILSSLVRKTSGKVSIMGVDIDQNFSKAKTYIGVVPQEFNFGIFERIEDIVINQAGYYGMPLNKAKKQCEFYLRELGLWEKRKDKAMTLSGGMKRRLMIARALVHEPEILVLDEPTAGVDIELRRSMWKFLKKLNNKGVTIILTTHYLEEAEQLCRNVAIINHGEIVEQSPMKNLLKKLNSNTVVFSLMENLPKNFSLPNYSVNVVDSTTVEISVKKGQSINEIVDEFSQKGISIESIESKNNRLEELFLEITGGDRV